LQEAPECKRARATHELEADRLIAQHGVVVKSRARTLSLRLPPGADAIKQLLAELRNTGAQGAAIVSAVGSFSDLSYAVTKLNDRTIVEFLDRQVIHGAIEICHFQGHFGFDANGDECFHCHGVFALQDGRIVGGHIFDARVLATLEVTLLVSDDVRWRFYPFIPPGESTPVPGLRFLGPERT
jgi:predicted DNA-binding protein with PD1-like motif